MSALCFEQGHIRITVFEEDDSLYRHSSLLRLLFSVLRVFTLTFFFFFFVVACEICLLCGAAVRPGDTYPAAQGACEPVHGVAHRSP